MHLNELVLMKQLISAKPDVFCIDIALILRTISYQAYYDPVDILKTSSAYDGCMDLSSIDFSLIDVHYNEEHEAFCIICRENATGRLVIAFRLDFFFF